VTWRGLVAALIHLLLPPTLFLVNFAVWRKPLGDFSKLVLQTAPPAFVAIELVNEPLR